MRPNDDEQREQLVWNLTNHTPNASGIKAIEDVRSAAKQFGLSILGNAPDSRERSTAITLLEQSAQMAIAAIARTETDDRRPGV